MCMCVHEYTYVWTVWTPSDAARQALAAIPHFCVHLAVTGCLGWFHILALVRGVAMSVGGSVSLHTVTLFPLDRKWDCRLTL